MSPAPGTGRAGLRRAIVVAWIAVFAGTQWPVTSLVNRIEPRIAGWPFLFAWLFASYLLLIALLVVLARLDR